MLKDLGALLRGEGYSQGGIAAAIGRSDGGFPAPLDFPVYERRLDAPGRLPGLLRLFLFRHAMPAVDVAALLAPLAVDDCEFLAVDGDMLRATVQITAFDDLVLAHDPGGGEMAVDHVLAPGPTARVLDNFTIRPEVATALDVGTGCGVQALRAAAHAERVVATDINERSLRFTEWNCALNGVDNVEVRLGNLFEPVAGERFDFVVCNPPFVISPEHRYDFMHSGREGDAISQAVIAEMPAHLADGGLGHVLCNWSLGAGEEWHAPVDRCLDGKGCEAVVLSFDSEDPLTYATRWNLNLASEPDAFRAALDAWTDYQASLGIAAIVSGVVVMRPRVAGVIEHRQATTASGNDAGRHMARLLGAEPLEDASVLDQVFTPAPGLVLQQVLAYEAEDFAVGGAVFLIPDGAGLTVPVAPLALHVVLALDGETPAQQLVSDAAAELELDPDELAASASAALADLWRAGLIERS